MKIKRIVTMFLCMTLIGICLVSAQDLIVTKYEELDVRILEVNEEETIYILKGKTAISSMLNSHIETYEWVSNSTGVHREFVVSSKELELMQDLQEELFFTERRAKRNMGLSGLFSLGGSVVLLNTENLEYHSGSILIGLGVVLLIDSVNARVNRDEIKRDLNSLSLEQFSYDTRQQLLHKAQQVNYLSLSDSGLGLQLNF